MKCSSCRNDNRCLPMNKFVCQEALKTIQPGDLIQCINPIGELIAGGYYHCSTCGSCTQTPEEFRITLKEGSPIRVYYPWRFIKVEEKEVN